MTVHVKIHPSPVLLYLVESLNRPALETCSWAVVLPRFVWSAVYVMAGDSRRRYGRPCILLQTILPSWDAAYDSSIGWQRSMLVTPHSPIHETDDERAVHGVM